jgi:hypothetical protein
MRYAVGVTVISIGALLVYSGFKNVNIWDTTLGVIRNQSPTTAAATAD